VSQENPLVPAVLAHPEDDTPRLICADWLEDHGDDARAQFIRAQCELAQLPDWDRRWQELTWLTEDLLARHGSRWRAELPVLDGLQWADFGRGFVSTVRVRNAETLYRHDAAIAGAAPVFRAELSEFGGARDARPLKSVPWLRAVRITGYRDFRAPPSHAFLKDVTALELLHYHQDRLNLDWFVPRARDATLTSLKIAGTFVVGAAFAGALAGAPWANRLTRLEMGTHFVAYNSGYFEDPYFGPAGARALAGSGNLTALTALNLGHQRIGSQGLGHLLTAPSLHGLRELGLRSNEITTAEPFRSSVGPDLVRLDLSDNAIGEGGAAALAESPRLAALACLGLDTCEITGNGVRVLTRAPFWGTLCRLDLSRNPLGELGMWALAEAKPPARLHALRLSDCDLDAPALEVLEVVPWLAGLKRLDLSRNPLNTGSQALLNRLADSALQVLSLAGAGLGPAVIDSLAPLWSKLVSLDLSDNHLTARLEALVAAGPARHLQTLRLRNCRLSRVGPEALLEAGACPSLHTLVLAGNNLGADTLRSLARPELPGPLRNLDLSRCGLGDEAASLLASAPALARLERLNLRYNSFGEQGLVTLARSPYLREVPEVLLSGNPWGFAEASRRLLADRFGPGWFYREYEEEPQDEGNGE
jgi:uncharacterized protein (TIGR02996 family)